MINVAVKQLLTYGVENNLVNKRDLNYVTNRILETLNLNTYNEPQEEFHNIVLEDVLEQIISFATQNNIISNEQNQIEIFTAKIMNTLLPMPHEINDNFKKLYRISPKKATNWFYNFSKDSNYVDKFKSLKNIKWSTSTTYGKVDLCVDVYKSDALNQDTTAYPKCELCQQNEGKIGKSNLRMIPITLNKEDWMFWYAKDGYFNEQCVASAPNHSPVIVNADTFTKLFEFLNIFPHYFIGMDSNLPFAKSYQPTHEAFCGGNYEFAIARCDIETYFQVKRFEDIQAGILDWPVSTIRMRYKDYTKLVKFADYIYSKWKTYRDDSIGLIENQNMEPCNSIISIARKIGDLYELDIILRNNSVSEACPNGVFNTHSEYEHIKKGYLNIIDIMGMLVLPASVYEELKILAEKILEGEDLRNNVITEKYAKWVENLIMEYDDISNDNIMEILQNELGRTYIKMLECAAVFKRDNIGKDAFNRFINTL